MFGILRRRRKPIVHAHWFVPLMDFRSDPEALYKAVEEELSQRQVPAVSTERVDFRHAGWISNKRTYFRILRERVVLDLCSAPFGTGWFFSLRVAEIPRILRVWELVVTVLGLGGFFLLYWQMFGLVLGSIVLGGTFGFLLLLLFTARVWTTLEEFILYMPVIGALYEGLIRGDTYQQQDHRLVYANVVNTVIRTKVTEFCAAGGVASPDFVDVGKPEQVLSPRQLAKYLEKRED